MYMYDNTVMCTLFYHVPYFIIVLLLFVCAEMLACPYLSAAAAHRMQVLTSL